MEEISSNIINIFKYTWPTILIFTTILLTFRIAYILKNKKKVVIYEELLTFLALIYLLCLFYVVTYQDVSWSSSNFIPFKEITRYTFGSNLFIRNVLGNMLLFTPFGFFSAYYLKSKKIIVPLILTAIASIVIEATQYKIGRVFDIDDIILNIAGGGMGFLLYNIVSKIHSKLPKLLKKTPILNIIILVLIIVFIIYFINI